MTALDREKLARVLGMLGSEHDGEVIAAARQAERIRCDAGMTWGQILTPVPVLVDDHDAANDDLLTPWEQGFLSSLRRQTYPMTPRQREVLDRIRMKVERGARAAA
jgi:hypothetical protein